MPHYKILGSAQDGGVPHIGCICARCVAAQSDGSLRRLPPSLGFWDEADNKAYIIDATPALGEQVERMRAELPARKGERLPVDALFLTHAHLGHYPGILFLGREAASARKFPVYCTTAMKQFLLANKPFSHLAQRGEVEFREMRPGERLQLTPQLSIEAFEVPHRNEDADTVAFIVRGERQSLFYMPDHDEYTDATLAKIAECDIAFIDGTFYSEDEMPPARMKEIGHPPITESMQRLRGMRTQVVFTHLNHSNRVLDAEGAAAREVTAAGFAIAQDNLRGTLQ